MLNPVDKEFHNLYQRILGTGALKEDRTGVGTIMMPAQQMRFDCSGGKMPILSTRKIFTRSFIHEMLWFISGNSSIKYLRDNNVGIWDSWFIKGTDQYDKPTFRLMTLEERIGSVTDPEQQTSIKTFLEGYDRTAISVGSAQYMFKIGDVDVEWRNVAQSGVERLHRFLDNMATETSVKIGGGEPISLQRRLARVSKNDTEKWGHINQICVGDLLVDSIKQTMTDGAPRGPVADILDLPPIDGKRQTATRVTLFCMDRFVEVDLHPDTVAEVWNLLDEMKVPEYELLDADIGQGGYGPQWRKWQDTQIVNCNKGDDVFNSYLTQGYRHLGNLDLEERRDERFNYGDEIFYREIDQLQNVIDKLKSNPDDRRMIVTAHNPGRTWQAALPPCHLYFQFTTSKLSIAERDALYDKKHDEKQTEIYRLAADHPEEPLYQTYTHLFKLMRFNNMSDEAWHTSLTNAGVPERKLSLTLVLRSNDVPLGAVFNVAQYALLLHMVAQVVDMEPDELITLGVDSHIYMNQVKAIKELLERSSHPMSDPKVVFRRKVDSIDDFEFSDIEIVDYHSHDKIDIPVAV